ncbi:MAG: CHAT domain-containing protein [Planctomycetota bacterium]|nr:CHAT domain-containing protein [Planctomycetota bacterium]
MPVAIDTNGSSGVIDEVLAVRGYRNRMRKLRSFRTSFSPELSDAFVKRAGTVMRKDPAESSQMARLGLLVANVVDDPERRFGCLRTQAEADLVGGSFPSALRALDRVAEGRREEKNHLAAAEIEALRISALLHLDRHGDAREAGRRALEIAREHEDVGVELRVRMSLAELAFRADRPREALRHYARVDALLPSDASRRVRAVIAVNRANALEACNRFQAAMRHFDIARELFAAEGCDHTVAQVEYNAAYADALRGRFEDALRRYARTEEAFLTLGDERHLALIDLDRAEIHLHLNLAEDALAFARRAEVRFRKLKMAKEHAFAIYLAAHAADLLGRETEADADYVRAAEAFAEIELAERHVACLVRRAGLATRSHSFDDARSLLFQARNAGEASMNPLTNASIGLMEARLALAEGSSTLALHGADTVRIECRRIHAPWVQIEANRLVGRAHAERSEFDAAILAYKAAIEHLEAYRGGVPPDEYMAAFLGGSAELYADIIDLLVKRGHTEMAFEFAERAKSRALVDLISHRREDEEGGPVESIFPRRARYLREKLTAIYNRLFRHASDNTTRSMRFLRDAYEQAHTFEQEISRLMRGAGLDDADGASPAPVDIPDPELVRRDLDADTVLLEYFQTNDALYIFVVTADAVHVERVDVSIGDVRRALERFQFHIVRHEFPHAASDDLVLRATRANLATLGSWLIDPVSEHLTGKRLVVVPHGPLHRFPFHALPHGEGWLADRFEVLYAPCAGIYWLCGRREPSADGGLAVFGLPDETAPEIRDEARHVAGRFDASRVYMDDQASFEALQEEVRTARLVHVATHGMFRPNQPMMSAIRLADGWATLYDLYRLDVRGELIVLSTCESGIAGVTDGDEVLGLARGLLCAGAPAFLASQWRVNDGVTREFMDEFYAALETASDAAAAHQQAMRAVRARHPHPYFWAPFFLTGRPVARLTCVSPGTAAPRREELSGSTRA